MYVFKFSGRYSYSDIYYYVNNYCIACLWSHCTDEMNILISSSNIMTYM